MAIVTEENYEWHIKNFLEKNENFDSSSFYSALFFVVHNNNLPLFKEIMLFNNFNEKFDDYFLIKDIIKKERIEMLRIYLDKYEFCSRLRTIFLELTAAVIQSYNFNLLKLMYDNNDLYYKFHIYKGIDSLRSVFLHYYHSEIINYIFTSGFFKINFDDKKDILSDLIKIRPQCSSIKLFISDNSFYPYFEYQDKELYNRLHSMIKIKNF